MPRPIQLARLALTNEIIVCVGSHGRKFLSSHGDERVPDHPERFSRFEYGEGLKPRLKYRDKYTWKLIDIAEPHRWHGFSDGGTLRSLVINLGEYIVHGKPIRQHFGPWPETICRGDLWGYGQAAGDAMRAQLAPVLERAARLVDPSYLIAVEAPRG